MFYYKNVITNVIKKLCDFTLFSHLGIAVLDQDLLQKLLQAYFRNAQSKILQINNNNLAYYITFKSVFIKLEPVKLLSCTRIKIIIMMYFLILLNQSR